MMFTPKGLVVNCLQRRMFSRRVSAFMPPAPMMPSAPALEQAAANSPVAMLAMPPWMMGYLVPKISFKSFIKFSCERLPPRGKPLFLILHDHAAPGQAAAKADAGDRLPRLQLPGLGQLVQGYRMLAALVLPWRSMFL